jgi:thiamine-phosphate diphosphorylase
VTPVICLITDRLRLGPAWEPALIERVRVAARAGVHLVHVRERDLAGGPIVRLTEHCVEAVRGTRARVVVNDRLDVALATRAHGVHLRGDSMDAARVRRVVPAGFLIGRSVHSAEEARAVSANGAVDYLVFGSVFETMSKPGREAAGLDELRAVSTETTVPVLAVGGISPSRAAAVARAGASGIAAIGVFADGPVDAVHGIVVQIVTAFDTPERVS